MGDFSNYLIFNETLKHRNTMSEVMIDLETLSLRVFARILTIGAVKFDRTSKGIDVSSAPFYRHITAESCAGLDVDAKTEKWWAEQADDVRNEAFNITNAIPLKQALEEFSVWYKGAKCIWSQGASFDVSIMEEAYRRLGMETPWRYYQVRDTRTVYDAASFDFRQVSQTALHHAVKDCERQVDAVQQAFAKLTVTV